MTDAVTQALLYEAARRCREIEHGIRDSEPLFSEYARHTATRLRATADALTGSAATALRALRVRIVNTPTWASELNPRTASDFRTDVLAALDEVLFAEESP